MSMLEIRGLTRRFGGLTAVDAVDLGVAEHEFVSIIGPNGAGKTTLFNLVTGLDEADIGTVRLEGRDVSGFSPEKLAALDGTALERLNKAGLLDVAVFAAASLGTMPRLIARKQRKFAAAG